MMKTLPFLLIKLHLILTQNLHFFKAKPVFSNGFNIAGLESIDFDEQEIEYEYTEINVDTEEDITYNESCNQIADELRRSTNNSKSNSRPRNYSQSHNQYIQDFKQDNSNLVRQSTQILFAEDSIKEDDAQSQHTHQPIRHSINHKFALQNSSEEGKGSIFDQNSNASSSK